MSASAATQTATNVTLLLRLRNRDDHDAWSRFVEIYGPIVYRLAKKKGLDRAAADELVQVFLVRMVEVMPRFSYDPARGRFRKWVLTVALNEIRHWFRKAGSTTPIVTDAQDEPAVPEDEARWWESAEAARMLQVALDSLRRDADARQVEIFEALVLQRRKPVDVAAAHAMNRNQVDGIKFRMLKRIRAIAQRMWGELDEQ